MEIVNTYKNRFSWYYLSKKSYHMIKQELLLNVIEQLTQEVKRVEQNLTEVKKAAAEAPGAMQSHSDTTKFQMSQLAGKIQNSINEKISALSVLQKMAHSDFCLDSEKIQIGSLVETLNENREQEFYFILPVGAGIKIINNTKTILIITPQTPLGATLMGKRGEEMIKLQIGHRERELLIVSVL